MESTLSNFDLYFLIFPMLAVLFVMMFRLDELLAKPRVRSLRTQRLSDWDKDGRIVVTDPGGVLPSDAFCSKRVALEPDWGEAVWPGQEAEQAD